MKNIILISKTGSFAENKDIARGLRLNVIEPSLIAGENIVIDFYNIEGVTQSFVHALLSDVIRKNGVEIINRFQFKNCNETIKKIISIVVDYMQESD